MGYRLPDERNTDHRKHINDTARQTVISIDNGTINHMSIPSFYREHHNRYLHDHLGWPYPGHPDRSCQAPFAHEFVLNEIDLVGEGYDSVVVSMVDPPNGLSFTGSIDYNVISFDIVAMCDDAIENDIDVTFAAYAAGTIDNDYDDDDVQLRDVITKGVLHIVAGPIG